MAVRLVNDDASSQMRSSHHDIVKHRAKEENMLTMLLVAQRQGLVDYLHPASLSRRAYIFPISPMPMMPIAKLSMTPVNSIAPSN